MCDFGLKRLIGSNSYVDSSGISAPRSSRGLKFLLGVGTHNMYNILKGHQAIWFNS